MPTRRTIPTLTLADLNFDEDFALRATWWRPGSPFPTRWRTWADYFRTYVLVRAELLAQSHPWPPFAETALAVFQRDPDRFDPEEAKALDAATRDAYRAAARAAAVR